jgi:hypothetical protein
MAKKKNQHFVPQFLLRNFSPNSQEKAKAKEINLFNISSKSFKRSVSLKDQASKDYFYGRDLEIDNALTDIEHICSIFINSILEELSLPALGSIPRKWLLIFIFTLYTRTLSIAKETDEISRKLKESILSIDSESLSELEKSTNLSLTQLVQMTLGLSIEILPLVTDLYWKLIINETGQPFIISDNPVVLYNQFLEPRRKHGRNTGMASKGLELFLPISPQLTLVLFDKDVYKIGTRNKDCIRTKASSDIKVLNLLQCINADHNIYFNDEFSEEQAQDLLRMASRYRKQKKVYLNTHLNEFNNRTLLHCYSSEIKCSLRLSFVNLLTQAKSYFVEQTGIAPVRNEDICFLYKKFQKMVAQGSYKDNEFYKFVADLYNVESFPTVTPQQIEDIFYRHRFSLND